MSRPHRFVFCVCGGDEHLARLRRAAGRLARFSETAIAVVTDRRRTPGVLPDLPTVDLAAPDGLSDRAAVVWLKSRLAGLFPEGLSCYLDTDVLAVAPGADEIFDAFHPPVTFAPDLTAPHADLRTFSPHAVRCPCHEEAGRLERFARRLEGLTALHARRRVELAATRDPELYRRAAFRGRRLLGRRGPWWTGTAEGSGAGGAIRWSQDWRRGHPRRTTWRFAGEEWALVQAGGTEHWEDSSGHRLRWRRDDACEDGGYWEGDGGESLRRGPEGTLHWFADGLRRREWHAEPAGDHGGRWLDDAGADLGACDHLAEGLERDLGVRIADRHWVPWNGGVFLFSGRSAPVLERWWRDCERLWRDPYYTERDQGALVATVWGLGLERHPLLPPRFNWIVTPGRRGARAPDDLRFAHFVGGCEPPDQTGDARADDSGPQRPTAS